MHGVDDFDVGPIRQAHECIADAFKAGSKTLAPVTGYDNEFLVRPVRPEDAGAFTRFFESLSPEDVRLRFFASLRSLSPRQLARFTQIDYARAMAFVAIDQASGEMLGVGRVHMMSHSDTAEYAVLVRSDLKGRGLGWTLMEMIIEYARADGLQSIEGQVLRENVIMLQMCRELGFRVATDLHDGTIMIVSPDLG